MGKTRIKMKCDRYESVLNIKEKQKAFGSTFRDENPFIGACAHIIQIMNTEVFVFMQVYMVEFMNN